MTAPASHPPKTAKPKSGFWRRHLGDPILRQLSQGITPDKIAATLAIGAACALLPFLGFTALLTLGVGLVLRMNQPILQTLNQLIGPLQILMIAVYVRAGEWIWRAPDRGFSVTETLHFFHHATLGEFLRRFGWAGVYAFTAWLVSVPVIITVLYYTLRPLMRRLSTLHPSPKT